MNAAQIAQELKTLEAKNKTYAEQLRVLYQRYLEELSNAASQQLIMVCYQLCTESYPEAFLGLSPRDRQVLQDRVRQQGEKLRQQLSLEGLLEPDPGDVEEGNQPRIAVIKAELTSDDLEILTSALDEDNSDRVLSLLKDKEIDLPFDLEAMMRQRQRLKPGNDTDVSNSGDEADELPELEASPEELTGETKEDLSAKASSDLETAKAADQGATPEANASSESSQQTDVQATPADSPAVVEGYSSISQAADAEISGAGQAEVSETGVDAEAADSEAGAGRSLGRRFLEDILSRRALDRSRSLEEASSMSGEGSLKIEARDGDGSAKQPSAEAIVAAEAETQETSSDVLADSDTSTDNDAFAENNGFDPDFEPPPAEDRYESTPLKSSDKLDISPGVLASALAAEGEDDRGGMLMRPIPYDGTTELSETALRDPFALIRWVDRMERGISQRLRQSSQRMTRSLEKCNILNNELPDGLLEAAMRPDGDHQDDSDSNMPHVLSLKLQAAGKEGRPRKDKSIRIVAIYLRLSELEFATPGVMAWRNQLRSQVKQLRKLSKEYKACKHAQNVVDAQELWRGGWGKG